MTRCRPRPRLLLLMRTLLLALVASNAVQRAQGLTQTTWQPPPLAADGAASPAAAATAAAADHAVVGLAEESSTQHTATGGGDAAKEASKAAATTDTDIKGSSGGRRGGVARPLSDKFQHPLAQPTEKQQQAQQAAAQAHAEMQRWLEGYFSSPTSRLTSARLAAAQRAAAAAAAADEPTTKAAAEAAAAAAEEAAATPAAEAEEAEEPGGFVDVLPSSATSVSDGAAAPTCNASSATAACARAAAKQLLVQRERPSQDGGRLLRLRWPRFQEDRQRWAAGKGPDGMTCLPRQQGEAVRRDYLLVVPVGNNISSVLRWLDLPYSASFDLVLLHYGNATQPPPCPRCAAVLSMAGPKWHLLLQATRLPGWRKLAAGKRAIMVADDDLAMDTCTINRAFEVFSAYGLLMGQPSLCPTKYRPTWYMHLIKEQASVLRFVTMVEIMAPMFEMSFFESFVRPSLHDAYTGWGLDFAWPFLLQYPRDRIGVIDDVCITHMHLPQGTKGDGSVYEALAKVVPYDAREEEFRRNAQYGYYPSEVAAVGFGYRPLEVVGVVSKPAPPLGPPLPETEPAAEPLSLASQAETAGAAEEGEGVAAGTGAAGAAEGPQLGGTAEMQELVGVVVKEVLQAMAEGQALSEQQLAELAARLAQQHSTSATAVGAAAGQPRQGEQGQLERAGEQQEQQGQQGQRVRQVRQGHQEVQQRGGHQAMLPRGSLTAIEAYEQSAFVSPRRDAGDEAAAEEEEAALRALQFQLGAAAEAGAATAAALSLLRFDSALRGPFLQHWLLWIQLSILLAATGAMVWCRRCRRLCTARRNSPHYKRPQAESAHQSV